MGAIIQLESHAVAASSLSELLDGAMGSDNRKRKYDCYMKTCAYPGLGKEYRCNDEAGLGFPSHCSCVCHKEKKAV